MEGPPPASPVMRGTPAPWALTAPLLLLTSVRPGDGVTARTSSDALQAPTTPSMALETPQHATSVHQVSSGLK